MCIWFSAVVSRVDADKRWSLFSGEQKTALDPRVWFEYECVCRRLTFLVAEADGLGVNGGRDRRWVGSEGRR